MIRLAAAVLILCMAFACEAECATIRVASFSQQYGQSSARIGASITVREKSPGLPQHHTSVKPTDRGAEGQSGGSSHASGSAAATPQPPPYPTILSTSPLLQKSTPVGPGSFWYADGTGQMCIYAADASPDCYAIVAPQGAGAPVVAAVDPAAIAAEVADRLTLTPGRLQASPSTAGLTGAPSWFWLSPAPSTESLSATLGGEAVTVNAVPQIDWEFGDGTDLTAGPGVPYAPGQTPLAAVTHVYATRCLPGDQGSDPYVLPSCGSNGYAVTAAVTWQISYQAGGAVTETGTLHARTTISTVDYPVSEVRAFLTGGASE